MTLNAELSTLSCPATLNLLPVGTVFRLERLLGGDPVSEEQILRFIGSRYGARSLLYLPPAVAAEILRRPADFVRAARQFCQPELGLET